MKTSEKGIEMIKSFETLELRAYRCPAGVLTIGYGHTGNVREGQTCTEAEADRWLCEDIREAEKSVNTIEPAKPLSQNQYDALVSFVYNVGGSKFQDSTLFKKVRANPDNPTIRDEFERWIYSKGRVLSGLVNRRNEEADLYFSI